MGFPGGSVVKEPAYESSRCRFDPWVEKIPWRRNWQPISVFLPGKSHGQRSLVGCNRWACKRVVHKLSDQMPATDTHNRFICALETSRNLPGSCLVLYFCQCVLVIFISLFKCSCLKYWPFQAFYLCQFLSEYLFDLSFQFFFIKFIIFNYIFYTYFYLFILFFLNRHLSFFLHQSFWDRSILLVLTGNQLLVLVHPSVCA